MAYNVAKEKLTGFDGDFVRRVQKPSAKFKVFLINKTTSFEDDRRGFCDNTSE